jgi:sulfur carrier protein
VETRLKIKVNGTEVELETELTVKELLSVRRVEMPDYVTVQINDAFVEQSEFTARVVRDGDAIEFLYFMGGGMA